MPHNVDSIRFSSAANPPAWPQISSPGAHLLAIENGDLRLQAGRKLVFPGDAPLSVSGDLVVSAGTPTPKECLRVGANGKVSIHGDLTVNGLINGSDIAALQRQVETLQQQVDALRKLTQTSLLPTFQPLAPNMGDNEENAPPWVCGFPTKESFSFQAVKAADKTATGFIPLSLPDGATVTHLRVAGSRVAGFYLKLLRSFGEAWDSVAEGSVSAVAEEGPFQESFPAKTEGRVNVIDNARFGYSVYAYAAENGVARITQIGVVYNH